MSRIGTQPIHIPDSVTVSVEGQLITVKGPLGQLSQVIPQSIKPTYKDNQITFTRSANTPEIKSLHGLARALVNNLITGVTQGFTKELELVGTGYRVAKAGDKISLSVGYSHPIEVEPTPGVNLEIEGNNKIIIKGIDKQLVGQLAANIRAIRPPEPYKGKGIRYSGEVVRRKAGKAAKATA